MPQLVVVGIGYELASHVRTVTSVVVALEGYVAFLPTVTHDVEAHAWSASAALEECKDEEGELQFHA